MCCHKRDLCRSKSNVPKSADLTAALTKPQELYTGCAIMRRHLCRSKSCIPNSKDLPAAPTKPQELYMGCAAINETCAEVKVISTNASSSHKASGAVHGLCLHNRHLCKSETMFPKVNISQQLSQSLRSCTRVVQA